MITSGSGNIRQESQRAEQIGKFDYAYRVL